MNYLYERYWKYTSPDCLEKAESKILSRLRNKVSLYFQSIFDDKYQLRTLKIENNPESDPSKKRMTLLLIHGMGAGIGIWFKNLDTLSQNRYLYAIDMLGFARSSRYTFVDSVEDVERVYVNSIEEWRQKHNIDEFVMLGHSMGAYLAYAYAVKHPERVRHLILADPWGFSRLENKQSGKSPILFYVFSRYTILSFMRGFGPAGHYMLMKVRPDLGHFYWDDENTKIIDNKQFEDYLGVYDYIYHCNAQRPSGEIAYKYLQLSNGWAKSPMVDRIEQLNKKVPVTFLYGQNSYMNVSAGIEFHENRKDSYTDVKVISNCGHHIYSESASEFNKIINEICEKVDSNSDLPNSVQLNKEELKQKRIS